MSVARIKCLQVEEIAISKNEALYDIYMQAMLDPSVIFEI